MNGFIMINHNISKMRRQITKLATSTSWPDISAELDTYVQYNIINYFYNINNNIINMHI